MDVLYFTKPPIDALLRIHPHDAAESIARYVSWRAVNVSELNTTSPGARGSALQRARRRWRRAVWARALRAGF